MNWNRISSIAEIVSSLAILATLIYLAMEIRQNTVVLQSDVREAVMQGDVEWIYKQVEDPNLNILFKQDEPLTELEASQIHAYLLAFMRLKEANFRQYEAGVLDEATWQNYQSSIINGPLSTRQGRYWWINAGQFLFDQELSDIVTQRLADAPVPRPVTDFFLPAEL